MIAREDGCQPEGAQDGQPTVRLKPGLGGGRQRCGHGGNEHRLEIDPEVGEPHGEAHQSTEACNTQA